MEDGNRVGRDPVDDKEQVRYQRVDDKDLVVADLMGEDDTNREEYNDR